MRRKDNWVNLTMNKFENFLQQQTSRQSRQYSDKLPPRLQKHGISVAARVVGNGIRNFTKRTTGKDLAQLKNSQTRHFMLTKLTAIQVAVTNQETKYNLLSLACDTGSNLVPSLSPEGHECDYNFKKNTFTRDFIARYHQQCIHDYKSPPELKLPTLRQKKRLPKHNENPTFSEAILCRCNSVDEEKKERHSFLGCWQHKGIDQDEIEK